MKLRYYYISCVILVIILCYIFYNYDSYYFWIHTTIFSALSTGIFVILNKGDNNGLFGAFGEWIDKHDRLA